MAREWSDEGMRVNLQAPVSATDWRGRRSAPWRYALCMALPLLQACSTTPTGEWNLSGEIAAEMRYFAHTPRFAGQDDNIEFSPSGFVQPEIVYEWNDGDDRITLKPYFRWDADDDNRTHGDLREANWLHIGADWDLVVGIDRVFWGVTEARHLVDIINQVDQVEDIDEEDRLGQPMINLRLQRDIGTFSFFVLPGFRKRTFPDASARLRGALAIDDDDPSYDSGADERHVDLAGRWAHSFGNWDLGLAHFHGTSREPRLLPRAEPGGGVILRPHYDQIDQTSLDAQFTHDAWLLKLEALTRSGHGDRFAAAVAGFEYTFFQVMETDADIGLLGEYLYDGREDAPTAPPTIFDDDVFVGTRLTLNDTQDTALLLGLVVDVNNQSTMKFVELERRLGDDWTFELEARLFNDVDDNDALNNFRDDDFVTLRSTRHF